MKAGELFAVLYRAVKRGGECHLTALSDEALGHVALPAPEPLERLSGALEMDIAELRGVSDRTVQSDWRKARLLLHGCWSRARAPRDRHVSAS